MQLLWKKKDYYTIWVYVFVALVIQHAMRMCQIVVQNIFFTFSHKWYDFQKEVTEKKCVFWFSYKFFEKFFIVRRNERGMMKNV
jgi:hypothetical protein